MFNLFVDGAARGNPGPAGIGVVLKEEDKVILRYKAYIGHKTNNEAEYFSLIIGLKKAAKFTSEIKVTSDSKLLVNQVRGEFKVKQVHLVSLLKKVRDIQDCFFVFEIKHCFRENNKEADKLANEAIDEFKKGKIKEIKLNYFKQEKLF